MKTKKVSHREKRSKTLGEIKPVKNTRKFLRDKSRAEGSPSFPKTAKPYISVTESFR